MISRIFNRTGRLILIATAACGLAGCVAYVPPQTTTYSYYDSKGALVHVRTETVPQAPEPVYVAPAVPAYSAPVYVGPPVYLGFGFDFYNGGWGHYHGWHGGYHGWHHHGW